MAKDPENYSEKEMKARFEAALKSALNKPLKDKPKVNAAKKAKKAKRSRLGT
jgi:hypothetical protein